MTTGQLKNLGLIGISILLPASVALTETILLKNGSSLKGSIVQMSENDITLETADLGQVVIKRRTVQSITDGAPAASELPASPDASRGSAASPGLVNINNSVNHPAESSPAQSALQPAMGAAVTAQADSRTMLGGNLSFGVGMINSKKGDPGMVFLNNERGPALHWDVLSHRSSSGITFGVIGEGIVAEKGASKTHLYEAGAGVGWSSTPPAVGDSGGSFAVKLRANYAWLQIVLDKYLHYYHESSGKSLDFSGMTTGVDLGYTYLASGGAGIHFGASFAQGTLTTEKQCNSSFGSTCNHRVSIAAGQVYTGLAYRF